MKTLGARIRELRQGRGLVQRTLARELGISAAFVSMMELGHEYPSYGLLVRIATELGVSTDDLRSYDIRPPPHRDIKRLTTRYPELGLALWQMVEHLSDNLTLDEMLVLWLKPLNEPSRLAHQ